MASSLPHQIHDRVKKCIVTVSGLAKEKITLAHTFSELSLTTVDLVDITMELEDEFGISPETFELIGEMTVMQLCDIIQQLLHQTARP